MAASLLIECRGSTEEDLRMRIEEVQAALRKSGLPFGAKAAGAWPPRRAAPPSRAGPQAAMRAPARPCLAVPPHLCAPAASSVAEPQALEVYEFKHEPKDFKVFWDVRRGLIPIVGAARKPGTSMLLEDVACPVDK